MRECIVGTEAAERRSKFLTRGYPAASSRAVEVMVEVRYLFTQAGEDGDGARPETCCAGHLERGMTFESLKPTAQLEARDEGRGGRW